MKYLVPPHAATCERECKFDCVSSSSFSVYIEQHYNKLGERCDKREAPTQQVIACLTCKGQWTRNRDANREVSWVTDREPKPIPFDLDSAVEQAYKAVADTVKNTKYAYRLRPRLHTSISSLVLSSYAYPEPEFVTEEGYRQYLEISREWFPSICIGNPNSSRLELVHGSSTVSLDAEHLSKAITQVLEKRRLINRVKAKLQKVKEWIISLLNKIRQ